MLTVTPSASALDAPAVIRVSGLKRGAAATLILDATDAGGRA